MKSLGSDAKAEASKLDFLPFPDLESEVKNDVAYLKGSKLVPDSVDISGWVYAVETGRLKKVV